ncbi:DUF6731 family protein [Listeria riparia]|uniref:Uncharacterized protein n=1 Tax=Listeria riparia FSL S10-1204 TaxID=1265816 RepID=W7DDI8_9LIST|nr:DUF6731 family protein [Listeria riparia]EUJ43393.1 hypothetical protein PRIP_13784 [Listeria riparia FSL S10-1204]
MEEMEEVKEIKNKAKKRLVNFDFFRVCVIDGSDEAEKLYDLVELLNHLNNLEPNEKIIYYQEERARMNTITMHQDKPYGLFQFNLCRLREDGPGITSIISSELSNIRLEENEYIAEDINILYDDELHVLMVQRNMHSLSPSGLEAYFQSYVDKLDPNNNYTISLQLIPDIDSTAKAKGKEIYRKLTLRVASNKVNQITEDSVGDAFRNLQGLEGHTVEITITAKSQKNAKLKSKEIKNIIEMVEQDQDTYLKAEVSGKDSDTTPVEKFDLVRGKYRVKRFYQVPAKHHLRSASVLEDITPLYMNNIRNEIMKNLELNLQHNK